MCIQIEDDPESSYLSFSSRLRALNWACSWATSHYSPCPGMVYFNGFRYGLFKRGQTTAQIRYHPSPSSAPCVTCQPASFCPGWSALTSFLFHCTSGDSKDLGLCFLICNSCIPIDDLFVKYRVSHKWQHNCHKTEATYKKNSLLNVLFLTIIEIKTAVMSVVCLPNIWLFCNLFSTRNAMAKHWHCLSPRWKLWDRRLWKMFHISGGKNYFWACPSYPTDYKESLQGTSVLT